MLIRLPSHSGLLRKSSENVKLYSITDLGRFPGLARNTSQLREKAEQYQAGEITREEYDYADTLKRSELSNMAFYIQSLGEIVILAVIVGIMFGLKVNKSTENNNWGLSVLIAFASGVWLLLAIPWFIKEKRRAGQKVCACSARPQPVHVVLTCQGSTRNEYYHSRHLAAIPCHSTDLASQTIPRLPHWLFPPRRLPEHNRHRDWHSSK